jgi:hypothetical protein
MPQLGPCVRVHRQRFAYRFGVPIACVLLLALATLIVLAIHVFLPEQFDDEYRRKAWIIAVGAPIVCAVMMAAWVRTRGLVVRRHEHGFVIEKRLHVEVVRWDEIAAVWRSIFTGPFPAGTAPKSGYTVTTTAGRRVELPGTLARVRELGTAIEAEVTRRTLAAARAAVAGGALLEFGAYQVGRDEITFRTTSLGNMMLGRISHEQLTRVERVKWSDISEVRAERHWLRLKRPGARWDVYIGWNAVPNVPVLEQLVGDAMR